MSKTRYANYLFWKLLFLEKKLFARSCTKYKTQTQKVLCVDSTQRRKENRNSQNFAAFEFVIFFLAMRSGGYQKNAMKMHFFALVISLQCLLGGSFAFPNKHKTDPTRTYRHTHTLIYLKPEFHNGCHVFFGRRFLNMSRSSKVWSSASFLWCWHFFLDRC